MSTQEQVNESVPQFILYYMNVVKADPTLYPIDLSGICTLAFDESTSPPTVVCNDWSVGAYPAPSNADLLALANGIVLPWYNNWYIIPKAIADWQSYQISSADLVNVRADASMVGFQVYDTTLRVQKIWNGAAWAVMNTGTSSVTSSWSADSASIAFTANTPKVVDITGFTQDLNLGAEWTVDAATGKHTYTGGITRPFRVAINYSNAKLAPVTPQTFTTFISKNGSTMINKKRVTETFILTSILDTNNHCISACINMAPGDYIQLGAQYTATVGGITIRDVSYDISGC